MAKRKYYSPQIRRFLVSVLYHEARGKGVPMTVLTNDILHENLKDTDGWKTAEALMLLDRPPPENKPTQESRINQ